MTTCSSDHRFPLVSSSFEDFSLAGTPKKNNLSIYGNKGHYTTLNLKYTSFLLRYKNNI